MKERLTQKDLMFGIYRGPKGSINSGLNVWWNGRYMWPRKRAHGKHKPKIEQMQLEVIDGNTARDSR
jgi:hypothetical protein